MKAGTLIYFRENLRRGLTGEAFFIILIIVINIKTETLMRRQNVKICKGPGCRAWSSDRIARELGEIREALDLEGVQVCRVPCMKVCGGGASVRVNSNRKIVKLREVDDVMNALGIQGATVTCIA